MSGRFTDKVAVVTGGNSGIGLATARAFIHEGARVAITGRSDSTLKAAQTALGPDALVIKADVSRVPEIAAAMDEIKRKFGRIDALFANAGIGRFVPFEEVTEEFLTRRWRRTSRGCSSRFRRPPRSFPAAPRSS
jgi:NAD(P)-dependent dehydrogenase (short-subunit alcohol dehydrogenase family)